MALLVVSVVLVVELVELVCSGRLRSFRSIPAIADSREEGEVNSLGSKKPLGKSSRPVTAVSAKGRLRVLHMPQSPPHTR